MENDFTYYAFISYSHKDETWAKWIQEAIEHYRLPAIIRKEAQKQLPKKIAPVFRDATDLGVDVLVDGLHEELEKSRFLIVVCSPNSAKPNAEGKHFVDEEVSHFCELGRAKQIIPVIIEGTPEESFGPVLKSKEILALDATKQSKARILNDIVAKILGLKPDELWQRAKRERRIRMVRRVSIFTLQGMIAIAAIWYMIDWNEDKVLYFKERVEKFGVVDGKAGKFSVAQGRTQIEKEQIASIDKAYLFVFQGYDSILPWKRKPLLRKWLCVNSNNEITCDPTDLHSKAAGRSYSYDEAGFPIKVTILGIDSRPVADWPGVAQIVNRFDDNGKLIEELFLDVHGEKTVSAGIGFCGSKFEYGEDDNVAKAIQLQPNGSYMEVQFNHLGQPVLYSTFRFDGAPCPNAFGVYSLRCVYDANGRQIEQEFLDANGNLMLSTELVAGWQSFYDHNGHEVERRFFGKDKEGKQNSDGYARITYSYNDKGLRIAQDYFDINSLRASDNSGFSGVRCEYDAKGRVVAEYRIDKYEKIVPVNGIEIIRVVKFDDAGNAIEIRYYDGDGNPKQNSENIYGFNLRYDDKGREIERRFINAVGDYCKGANGSAGFRVHYDDANCIVHTIFIDEHGMPSYMCFGDEKWEVKEDIAKFLSGGRVAKFSTFTAETAKSFGAVGVSSSINASGIVEEIVMMNDAHATILCAHGWAKKRYRYNEQWEVTEESYWNVNNEPAIDLASGVHKAEINYNRLSKGLSLDIRFFNTNGFPVISHDVGYAWAKKRYDKDGRLLSIETFDDKLEPICAPRLPGSKVNIEYDLQGRMVKLKIIGTTENLDIGFSYVDENIEMVGFGPDGRGVTKKIIKADDPKLNQLMVIGRLRYGLNNNRVPIDVDRND